ncbi:MAG TPA: AI-2E family transporter [Acidimicrobiia bacterium]|nr:AI-2E family transporter [Acidimicrobiia bacterium]
MPSDRLRRSALIVWTAVGGIALFAVFLFVAESIRVIWLPLVFAAGLVFLLEPTVRAFDRMGFRRVFSATFALVALAGLIVAIVVLVLPTIREQAAEFIGDLPVLWGGLVDGIRDVAGRLGYDVDELLTQGAIEEWLDDPSNQATLQELLFGFGAGAGTVIRGVTEAVLVIVLAPVLALYILIDLDKYRAQALELTPDEHRPEFAFVGGEVGTALGSFVRGQLLVALIVGIASSIGMWAIDLPFWLLIGMLAGLLNLIPFLGPFVGGALAAGVALLSGDLSQAIWAVLIFTAIQQIDNHVITPLVQRTRVKLSPMVIVLALIIGGSVAGLLGVLIAVPVTAAVRIIIGHLWRTRILGQSWQEASEAMIEVTPPPDRIAGIRRRSVNQSRLFDTAEIQSWSEGDVPPSE